MTAGNAQAGKTGGWSVSGSLFTGNKQVKQVLIAGVWTPVTVDVEQQVSMQANFPVAGDYTIEFFLKEVPVPGGASVIPIRAEALIQWTVEGNQVTRRVNVGNGVSVTGVGAAAKVTITDTTDRTALAANLAREYIVSASFAPGTRAATQQPPTLYPNPGLPAGVIDLPAAAIVPVTVPQDAGVIAVSVTVGSLAVGAVPIPDQGVVVFHTQGVQILKVYDPRVSIWVPIAPGAQLIQVQNNTANDLKLMVTFGIDG